MTERIGSGDSQRGVARLVLALMVAIALIAGGNFASETTTASAQPQGPTPTGAETTAGGATTPGSQATPTAATAIEFLNPSKYGSPEYISNKGDRDNQYHLVAWVSQPPADAVVEFQLQTGAAPPKRIGFAQRVGGAASDTFELLWDLKLPETGEDVPDGAHTLRAILFTRSSSGELVPIANDQESVTVDRNRETVEILDPANPGSIGLFDPDGTGSQLPGFTVRVQTSAGADHVRLFYSTGAPGAEPSWTTCQSQVTLFYGDRTKRIGCSVPQSQSHNTLTALAAAVVEDVPQSGGLTAPATVCPSPACVPASQRTESGDAHRLTANYVADARSLALSGATNATRRVCHEQTATVVDQLGKPIWRANVDVHAAGPGEGLQFATTSRTGGSKHPDSGGHERTEPLWNCTANPPANHASELQGVHQRAPQDDRKHIESEPTEGTNPAGDFVFALRSEAVGNTLLDAWVDENDDDVNDPGAGNPDDPEQDPDDSRTISWSAVSPSAPLSPSDSASPTATATATASATATATNTATPTASGTTGGGTTTQAPAAREVTLEASRQRVTFNKSVVLSGSVAADAGAVTGCTAFVDVNILRDVLGGASDFALFATETTDANGTFSHSFSADAGANYVAELEETPQCEAATSDPEPVLVKVKVGLRLSDSHVGRGARVRLTATTAPCPETARDRLLLFRSIEGEFGKVAGKRTNESCRTTFRRRLFDDAVFQARWPKQAEEFLAGRSRSKVVRVRRN